MGGPKKEGKVVQIENTFTGGYIALKGYIKDSVNRIYQEAESEKSISRRRPKR